MRLREGGLVAFVVSVAAVAIEIDDDVACEFLAVIEGDLRDSGHGERILRVDVENRRIDHFGHVGRVETGTRVGRERGETDLVVDDDVDGAAGFVTGELRHVENLGHDPLPREGSIAVDEKREDFFAGFGVAEDPLTRAGHALDDGIDGFEVARVRREADGDFVAGGSLALGEISEVVFHIAIAADDVGDEVFREFVEDEGERLAQEVGQNVEASAVGHAHDNLLDFGRFAALQDGVEDNEQRFGTLERETFLSDVTRVEEVLEGLGLVKLPEDGAVQVSVGEVAVATVFDALAEPIAHPRILNVHELGANGVAVDVAEFGNHFAQEHGFAVAEILRGNGALEVAFGETDGLERKERILRCFGR